MPKKAVMIVHKAEQHVPAGRRTARRTAARAPKGAKKIGTRLKRRQARRPQLKNDGPRARSSEAAPILADDAPTIRHHDFRGRLLRRYIDNPILTAQDWPYFVNSVFNCGATRLPSGETLLLCRAEDCSGLSHLCVARSQDGVGNWRIDKRPTLTANSRKYPEESWGVEDPRIVWVPDLEQYAVTYTCYSPDGPGVSLALTKDFRKFQRLGNIMPPEDKDAALFPYRFGGRWAMIHRPVPARGRAHIWISFSPDLRHWGDHTVVLKAKRGPWWDANKVGLSPPPIWTEEGWLILYHGVRYTPAGCLYRLGLAWPCSIWKAPGVVGCAARGGSWHRRRIRNVLEMWPTPCFHVDTRLVMTAIRSTSITVRPTPALPSPREAFAKY